MDIKRILKKGSKGEDVKSLQGLLNAFGNYGLAQSGQFDEATESAVKAFQTAKKLVADGVFGPKSNAALQNALQPSPKNTSSTQLEQMVLETATSFVGQKEVSGNMGFIQPFFLKLMESVGWRKSWSWCSIFCKLVYTEAYKKMGLDPKIITKYISPSVQKTRANFLKAGYPLITDWKLVKPGAYISWVSGSDRTKGHTGILVEFTDNGKKMITIEGNTNSEGSREGDSVAKKTRAAIVGSGKGLILQGWFNIIE